MITICTKGYYNEKSKNRQVIFTIIAFRKEEIIEKACFFTVDERNRKTPRFFAVFFKKSFTFILCFLIVPLMQQAHHRRSFFCLMQQFRRLTIYLYCVILLRTRLQPLDASLFPPCDQNRF